MGVRCSWRGTADCKSVAARLSRFESFRPHHKVAMSKKDTHGFSVCRWEVTFSFEDREQAIGAVNKWIKTYPEKWQTFPEISISETVEEYPNLKRRTAVTITGGVWASRLVELAEVLEKFDMDMN